MANPVKVEPVALDDLARSDLMKIGNVTAAVVDSYAVDNDNGNRSVWGIFDGAERVGTFVWSIAQEPDAKYLVIDEAYCRPIPGVSVCKVLHKVATELAARTGSQKLRFWTERAGLLRLAEGKGRVRYIIEAEAK